VYGWGKNQKRQANFACPCEKTKGDILQPVMVPLFAMKDAGAGIGRVEGVFAGYDSSGVVIQCDDDANENGTEGH